MPTYQQQQINPNQQQMEERLSALEKRSGYIPPQQFGGYEQPAAQANQPQIKTQTQPYVEVENEKQAREFEIDPINGIGLVHIFSNPPGSEVYVKRINPSNFQMEFKVYDERKIEQTEETKINDGVLQEINSRLDRVDQFIEMATSFFLNSNTKTNSKTKTSQVENGDK